MTTPEIDTPDRLAGGGPARPPLVTATFVFTFVAHFLHGLALHAYLHLPGFLRDLGADELRIGLLVAVMAGTAIAARPAIGKLMDVRGRRGVALVGGVLNVIASLLYLTVDSLGPWLYLVRVLHGVADAMIFSVMFTIAADVVPESRRTEGMALFGVSGMAPFALGTLLGDVVLSHAGYTQLFVGAGASAAIGLLATLPLRESRPEREPGRERRPFLVAALQSDLLPLWLVTLGFALGLSSYFTFIKTFVLDTGVGSVGLFFSAYAAAAIGLRLGFGWLPDRVGPKRVLVPSVACMPLGLAVLSQADGSASLALAGVLAGIGHGYTFPIVSGIVVQRTRAADRGSALSVFTALFDVGILIGGPVFGWVLGLTGYPTMFVSAGVTTTVALAAFVVWDRTTPEAA